MYMYVTYLIFLIFTNPLRIGNENESVKTMYG